MSTEYQDYLNSRHWKRLRRKLVGKTGQGPCCACGRETLLVLHHVNYDRLGKEEKCDLVPVCELCHTIIHDRLNEQWPDMPSKVQARNTYLVWPSLFGETMDSALDRYGWTGKQPQPIVKTIVSTKKQNPVQVFRTCRRCGQSKPNSQLVGTVCHACRGSIEPKGNQRSIDWTVCPKCLKKRKPTQITRGRCNICIHRDRVAAKKQARSPHSGYKPLVARGGRIANQAGVDGTPSAR